jgi:hypothetical protein
MNAAPGATRLTVAPAAAVSGDLPTIDDLGELVEFVQHVPNIFVRHSKGPVADGGWTSRDYESGVDMPGLSVDDRGP